MPNVKLVQAIYIYLAYTLFRISASWIDEILVIVLSCYQLLC